MNNLYQELQRQTPKNQKLPSLKSNLNQIQNILKSSDPNSLIQNMVLNNPQLKPILQLYKSSGMTPKEFFYQYAQQRGINPDQFLNS